MQALVTGGAGFIGAGVVAHLLEEGHGVRVLDNFSTGHRNNLPHGIEVVEADIRNASAVAEALRGVDTVFHLAACIGNVKSLEAPTEDSSVNVLGTVTLLEAARNASVRTVVYSSSAAIFGELHTATIDEQHPQEPISPYGVSKLAAEKHVLCFGRVYGIRSVCLRYFNVFGIRQRYDAYGNVIPIFAQRLKHRKALTIFGDGLQTRDFVHVADVAAANYLAATSTNQTGCFNVGTGTTITINHLAGMLQRISGCEVGVEHAPPRPGEVRHCRADISKIKGALGYEPRVDFEQGLRDYWAWFLEAT